MTCVLLPGSWTGSEHPWIEGSEPGHGLYLQIVTDPETDGAGKLQLKCKIVHLPEGVSKKPGPVYKELALAGPALGMDPVHSVLLLQKPFFWTAVVLSVKWVGGSVWHSVLRHLPRSLLSPQASVSRSGAL